MKDIDNDEELQNDLENTDIDIEVSELEDIEENSVQKIKRIKKQLKECEKEKMDILESLHRAKAEFLNGKRRLEEEKARDKERAIISQIEKLLPLCDSFKMAMSDTEAWQQIDATWRIGVESIHTQLQSILSSYNVIELNPIGEEFNPSIHDAMTNVPVTDSTQHHKVISVIQNGYVRKNGEKEELIRPARVTVGEYSV
jgi:molecular chaperone GrpE